MYSPTDLTDTWHSALTRAVRDVDTLFDRLHLPIEHKEPARRACELFPLMVTESYLARMIAGDWNDPLLRQVLPVGAEFLTQPGFTSDAVDDAAAHRAPGLLQKYTGRVLLIATGACAIHCRYCFRRSYPYGEGTRKLDDWEPALVEIEKDESIQEVILSGGDPLMLTDERLGAMLARLEKIEHLQRIRLHSRLPIVLPNRMTSGLIELLTASRLTPILVVHANHPQEIADDCANVLQKIVRSGVPTLNQSVLLRGVNDSADVLTELSERLVNLGVMPYYLHQLDHVTGTAHFEVDDTTAIAIVSQLRERLPGYAVPQLVRELPGELSKHPLLPQR